MYENIEKSIGYKFSNISLLENALTHTSYANEKGLPKNSSNEKLEFLGDAVLDLIISTYLFKKYENLNEGQLSKFRANVVCEDAFALMSRKLSLGESLRLGKGEILNSGMLRNSILADLYEAVIGAIYLDCGFSRTEEIVLNIMKDNIDIYQETFEKSDYKTLLQEKVQSNKHQKGENPKTPKYKVIKEEGPAHQKIFTVEVSIFDEPKAKGLGSSKKEAEQNAAKKYLEELERNEKIKDKPNEKKSTR